MNFQRTDEHDPWPLRLVIAGIIAIGLSSVAGIIVLVSNEKDVTGFFPIPVSAITALSMVLPRRPPWTSNGKKEDEAPTE